MIALLLSVTLMAACVALHALGVIGAVRWMERRPRLPKGSFWPAVLLLIRPAAILVLLSLAEISLWGFFVRRGRFHSLSARRPLLQRVLQRRDLHHRGLRRLGGAEAA